MKRKLLFAIVALMCSVGSWAVNGTELTATTTDCFLYNVAAEQYLTAGDWWGTHATIGAAGMDLDLTKISNGVYTIGTRQDGRFLSGVWMDAASFNFTFAEVDAENHYYTISWDDNGTQTYLYYTGSKVDATTTAPSSNAYYWQVISRADFLASLSGASSAIPKDATGAIYNAGFFCLDYATVKAADFPSTRSWQGTQLTDTWGYRANEAGVNGANYCVEQAGKSFDNYQNLTGLLNGAYILKNQGFYRGDKATYLYANSQKVALTKITAAYDAPEGYTGNDLQRSSYAIGILDMYHNTAPTVIVTDGTLRIGVTSNGESIDWSCFDNFTLSYLGVPSASNPIDLTSSPQDMTSKITNPNIEDDGDVAYGGSVSGWLYNTGATNHGTLNNQTGVFSGHAFENWKDKGLNDGQIYQKLTNLPDGVYKFDLAALVRTVKDQFIYVKSGNNTYRTFLSGDNGVAAAYSVYGIVDGGEMEIGLDINASGIDWCAIDNAALTYYGTSAEAYALVISQENNNVNKFLNTLDACALKTALSDAQTSYSTASFANAKAMNSLALALDENNAAFGDACNVSAGAASIAAVQYTGEASANSTLTAAISTQASTIAGDLTAVNSATATLRAAIKTYISAAEPANEGEYFDITCLIINPDFDNNDKTGWEGTTPNFGNDATQKAAKGCEFYQKSFDIHQTIEGLPTGSYTLSIYAFQRPGAANAVYNDYEAGSNNVTAKLYVNSDETSVTNIMAAKQSTRLATGGDESGLANNTYWVPNSMVGARAYFDHGLYDATVAALVETGTLNIGFKSPSYVSYDWTIFDEFRLRYYGSSKMIYYKQYLPQLEAEIAENFLNNNAYSILPAGQPEREALETANAADASKLNTEEDLKAAIDAITAARDNFAAAKAAYDELEAAKSAVTPELAYASAEKKAALNDKKTATATSLADARAKTDAITMALRAYYESNALAEGVSGAVDCTSKITNPTCPVTTHPTTDKYNYSVEGWTTSLIVANKAVNGYTNSNGIEREFYYASHGSFWANDQFSSVATMSQTVTDLEAGKYLLTVCAVVTDGATATLAANGAEQVCTTGASGGVYGKGWNDNSVIFTVGNTGTADISMTMNNNNSRQKWFSFDNFRLVRIGGLDDVTISEEDAQAPTAEAANVTLTRTLKGGQWNGFSVPFGFTVAGSALDGAQVKQFSSVTDNEITMTDATEIVAGEPYLVKPASDIVNPTFSGVSVVAATDAVKGTGDYTFQAHLYATDLATDGSVAYVSTTDSSIKKLTSGSIKGLRSIFNIPTESNVKALIIQFEDSTDGILSVDAEGNIVEGAIYNLAGQRISAPQRGVNIVNGKKVLVK